MEMISVYDTGDRRGLERNVLRSILEDEAYRKRDALASLRQDDFEVPEYRQLFGSFQIALLNGSSLDLTNDAAVEILTEGVSLNGSWSAAVERMKQHSFDRQNFPMSDLGNAERFQQEQGSGVRYDHTRKKWMIWNGRTWTVDETDEVVAMISSALRRIYVDAASLTSDAERKAMVRWGLLSESQWHITAALKLAKSLPQFRAKSEDFDRDPWLLNVQNGLLDLKRGTFLPHNHQAHCSKIAGVSYQEGAECPWWEDFLGVVLGGDPELIAFVQTAVGYSLTGITDAQAIFFAYGSGANGKSTFFEILRVLFGDYYQKAPSEMLLQQRSEGVPADAARLDGARLAVYSEMQAGRRLNEAKIKDLTGSEPFPARHYYGDWFHFIPTHKTWMYGNHKPIITGTDNGIWRRLHLIPFKVTIPEERRKPQREIFAHVRPELPGILNWALEGLEAYKLHGLTVPACVRAATDGYRKDSDTVGQFLNECCILDGEVEAGDLYEAYHAWAGAGAKGPRAFIESVKEHGHALRVGAYKKRFWQGLGLIGTSRT